MTAGSLIIILHRKRGGLTKSETHKMTHINSFSNPNTHSHTHAKPSHVAHWSLSWLRARFTADGTKRKKKNSVHFAERFKDGIQGCFFVVVVVYSVKCEVRAKSALFQLTAIIDAIMSVQSILVNPKLNIYTGEDAVQCTQVYLLKNHF